MRLPGGVSRRVTTMPDPIVREWVCNDPEPTEPSGVQQVRDSDGDAWRMVEGGWELVTDNALEHMRISWTRLVHFFGPLREVVS